MHPDPWLQLVNFTPFWRLLMKILNTIQSHIDSTWTLFNTPHPRLLHSQPFIFMLWIVNLYLLVDLIQIVSHSSIRMSYAMVSSSLIEQNVRFCSVAHYDNINSNKDQQSCLIYNTNGIEEESTLKLQCYIFFVLHTLSSLFSKEEIKYQYDIFLLN